METPRFAKIFFFLQNLCVQFSVNFLSGKKKNSQAMMETHLPIKFHDANKKSHVTLRDGMG